jgi:arsenate reductase
MSAKIYNVLFLCTGNSARSILAEALMTRLGEGRFRAFSAGSMPTGRVNPHAIALLDKLGFDTAGFRSKSWEEFSSSQNPDAPALDFVFTVCDNAAGEVCPIWPGQPMTAHWGVPDPAAVEGAPAEIALAFADAYRQLGARIGAFASLPMATLDRMTLQARLDEIGKTVVAKTPSA